MARNGEGLYPRRGVLCFRYRDPESGKWREKSTGQTKTSKGWREKQRFLQDLENGNLPTDMANWTLKQASDQWLEWRAATKSSKTASVERRLMRQVRKVIGDSKVLRTITPRTIEAYQATRRKSVEGRTVNLELFCLNQILKRAGLWSRFREHYKPLPVAKNNTGKVVPEEGIQRLIAVSKKRPEWHVGFWAAILAHASGVRGGEIKKLRVGDVRINCNDPHMRIRRESTKTDAGAREVPLNRIAQYAAARLMERAKLLGSKGSEDFLLPINRSKHTRRTDPRKGSRLRFQRPPAIVEFGMAIDEKGCWARGLSVS
jgi:integrase